MEPIRNRMPSEHIFLRQKHINSKYKQDLLQLKGDARQLIGRMMNYDLDDAENLQGALGIGQKLLRRVDDVLRKHLNFEGIEIKKKPFKLRDLHVTVKEICNYNEQGIIGGNRTHLALKNLNSYLVGTQLNGIKVIEKGSQVYSSELPEDDSHLFDTIYYPPEDCYFLASSFRLLRKDIDDQPPYVFMKVRCGIKDGACLIYSSLHQKLIINKDFENIAVINPKKTKIEIEVEKSVGNFILDFRVFGEEDESVVSVTNDGYIILHSLDYYNAVGSEVSNLEFLEEAEEMPNSIAVCKKNEYVCVEIGKNASCLSSRMVILKLTDNAFTMTASVDLVSQKIRQKWAVECFDYADRRILWVGLSSDENGPIQFFIYDTKTGVFKELEDRRESHHETEPLKLHRLGDKFYYTGNKGKLMSLSLTK